MSSKKPASKASEAPKETKFIGIAIEDFLAETSRQVEAGKFSDGTSMNPKVRTVLGQFTKSLREPKVKYTNYVFVFERYIFIFITF